MRLLLIVLPLALFTLALSQVSRGKGAHFQHIITIVLENTNEQDALAQPYLKALLKKGTRLANFTAEIHPSQGNYLAMIFGDTFGINHDDDVNFREHHVGDLLEAKGLSWKVYAEGYPGNCFKRDRRPYVRKHNPFISSVTVQQDPQKCARIVDSGQLDLDLKNNALPDYALYIPDLDNDGHDTGVAFADRWLKSRFSKIVDDANLMKDVLVVVTFDESSSYFDNSIYTVLLGGGVKPGFVDNTATNHYGLLKMIEDNFALGDLGRQDAEATALNAIWR